MSFAGIGLRGRNSRVRVEVLTNREKLVFQALRDGLTALETAKALAVSINTIKFHRKNRYSKLGVGSRLDAVRRFDAGEEAYSSWHA
jgi:LuxR family maltose regulon positive regulatory protein